MNYVNLENAKALKELGFDVPCVVGYTESGKETIDTAFNKNIYSSEISAPDFLTAADWLFGKHQLEFSFRPNHTVIFDYFAQYGFSWGSVEFTEAHGDHRNAAISFAIEQIKSRENENHPSSTEAPI